MTSRGSKFRRSKGVSAPGPILILGLSQQEFFLKRRKNQLFMEKGEAAASRATKLEMRKESLPAIVRTILKLSLCSFPQHKMLPHLLSVAVALITKLPLT